MEPQTTSGRPAQFHFDWSAKASVGPGRGEAAEGATRPQGESSVGGGGRDTRLKQDLMARVADKANLVEALAKGVREQKAARALIRCQWPS